MSKIIAISLLLIINTLLITGCSSNSKTVTTETSYSENEDYDSRDDDLVTKQSTTTTQSEDEDSDGILSSTVEVIGEIIALPFRAVAGLIRWIF